MLSGLIPTTVCIRNSRALNLALADKEERRPDRTHFPLIGLQSTNPIAPSCHFK
jgi:hypothetical protein